MSAHTEHEIQQSYQGYDTAAHYVAERFTSELMRLLHDRQVAAVNRVMREASPARSLEIAPGPGRLTREIVPAGELICLEFNEGMIEVGKAACRNGAVWAHGNAFELPFECEFDFVYTFRFVRHFHRADRDRLYSQIRKALRPGGWLVMDAVNATVSEPLRVKNPQAYPIYDKLYRDEDELLGELTEAGFENVSLQPVQRWFDLQYKAQVLLGPRSGPLCRFTVGALERLRRGPALEWIVTARTS